MKRVALVVVAVALSFGAAQAQTATNSMNKDENAHGKMSPGTVGAMNNVGKDGVATGPEAIKAQDGKVVKASPGTVGAAPGADVPSSNPAH